MVTMINGRGEGEAWQSLFCIDIS